MARWLRRRIVPPLERWLADPRVVAGGELATVLALWWALLRLLRDLREGRRGAE